jgi:RimJ/RimL family protein N-acetyltransferase
MTAHYAQEITTWRYPAPYERYTADADAEFFLDPVNGYVAVVEGDGDLIAYRCFGADGQVPGGDYSAAALDTGGGLRPDLTGRGLGRTAIAEGLAYGRERFAPPAFRITVATFNERAQRVVRSLGFAEVSRFESLVDGDEYVVLLRRPA